MRVSESIMPSEAIEMLRGPLESLSFVQLVLLGFWVLGVAARRGVDATVEVIFVRLLRSELAGEQRRSERGKKRQDTSETKETRERDYGFAAKGDAWDEVPPGVYVGESRRTFPSTEGGSGVPANWRYKKVYVVRRGCRPGLYLSWAECEQQVKGFSGARYKSFKSWSEAEEWLHARES